MPPFPGEERLITVYTDVHYYFAQPTAHPILHRFDKASYLYIYYNSTRHTSRIEIANNVGTPDQDAFNGYLDTCRVVNSSKFPTLMTIIVDDITPTSPTSPKTGRDPDEWRLSSADPRDPNRTKYKIHTLDIYLWAQDDANLLSTCFSKTLLPNQLDFPEPVQEPGHVYMPASSPDGKSAHQANDPMSPVVQNLEKMAVSDPAYNDLHRGPSQRQGQNTTSSITSFNSSNLPPPPPPPAGMPGYSPGAHSPSPVISDISQPVHQTASKPQSTDFTPMAYNPAAPAAPEPIAHREKTPPPEDGDGSTGLAQAAKFDHGYSPGPSQGYQIGQGPPVTFGGGYASPPPQHPGYTSPPPPPPPMSSAAGGYTSPPPPPPMSSSAGGYNSPPPPPPMSSTAGGYSSPPPPSNFSHLQDQRTSVSSNTPSFGPPPSQAPGQRDSRHSVAAETYVPNQSPQPPDLTPGSQFYGSLASTSGSKPLAHVQPQYMDYLSSGGPGAPTGIQSPQSFSGPPPPQQAQQKPLPLGGYSNYDYRAQSQSSGSPYDVHSQVYRPTEAEAGSHGRKQSRVNSGHSGSIDSGSGGRDRRESKADRVEKGVGRLFKKIEKKIG